MIESEIKLEIQMFREHCKKNSTVSRRTSCLKSGTSRVYLSLCMSFLVACMKGEVYILLDYILVYH